MKARTLFIFYTFLLSTSLSNNLRIKNVRLLAENTAGHYRYIQFDISWENSWRRDIAGQDYYAEPYNWDAVWVFVKYQVNSGEWKHCTLSKISGEHIAPSRSKIDAASDGMGIFIYKNSNGVGSSNFTSVKMRWNYGADSIPDGSNISGIKVPGIEMVYISQGSFYAGDGIDINDTLNLGTFRSGSNDKSPWYITSENAINVTNTSSGGYYYVSRGWPDEEPIGTAFTIPASFPKGYKAIYCMKYEITQGEYADFLNLLNSTQATNRFPNYIGHFRYTISKSGSTYEASRVDRACNYLSWADGCAYSDWSGLRPMTELEYEKICRGPKQPISGEYAWGSTNIDQATTISGIEDGTEKITNSGANCCYMSVIFSSGDGRPGPLRVGIFATGSTNREQSGAGYYGVMEMSGNLRERCVTVGNSTSRSFTGLNGDGSLTTNGDANISNWPGITAGFNALGASFRGGGFDYEGVCVSYRIFDAANEYFRGWGFGFRSVRHAP